MLNRLLNTIMLLGMLLLAAIVAALGVVAFFVLSPLALIKGIIDAERGK